MGNTDSRSHHPNKASSHRTSNHNNSSHHSHNNNNTDNVTARAQKVIGEMQANIQSGIQQLEEQDHPAAQLIDTLCQPYLGATTSSGGGGGVSSSGSGDHPHRRSTTTHHHSNTGGGHKKSRRYNKDPYSEEDDEEDEDASFSETDDRTLSEDETATTNTTNDYPRGNSNNNNRRRLYRRKYHHSRDDDEDEETTESASYLSQSDYESTLRGSAGQDDDTGRKASRSKSTTTDEDEESYDDDYDDDEEEEDESYHNNKHSKHRKKKKAASRGASSGGGVVTHEEIMPALPSKPLASAFAKRCYFTKAGIGKTTQHYEGLTLTGNVVLMLAAAMKLKGCPTICDEDLRRVEQTFPNQFSRLPDELLLSSGWRRISKYCHFSNKPIPDGVPFFHSKQRLHPNGGYFFLLAAAVGMVRPMDVEPLHRDTLVLLETDFPTACDAAPPVLIQDPAQWTLVDKFCFFSGGPINTDEDVYYQADFDGNAIYMLAFLSPSLTPAELYKLEHAVGQGGLETVAAVQEVESVYDLTERDFDDLKLYHLGPCRALPPYILQPTAWTKVLPPHFLEAREAALMRAVDYDPNVHTMMHPQIMHPYQEGMMPYPADQGIPPYPMEQQQSSPLQGMPMPYQHPHHHQMDQQLPPGIAPYPMEHHQPLPGMHPYAMEHQPPSHEQANYYSAGFPHAPLPAGYGSPQQQQLQHPHLPAEMPHMESLPPGAAAEHTPVDPRMMASETSPFPVHAELPTVEENQQPALSQPIDAPTGVPVDSDDYDVDSNTPMDEAHDAVVARTAAAQGGSQISLDPPEDEPPSLKKDEHDVSSPIGERLTAHTMANGGPANDDERNSRAGANRPNLEIDPQASEDYSQAPSEFNKSAFSASSPLPPKSPASEFSPSSAMKGAQDMLRRNRQRRVLEAARKRQEAKHSDGPNDEDAGTDMVSPRSDSESTWESGMTSEVSGSSVWTDNVTNPDRSSRRALILQMAKARMRSNKSGTGESPSEASVGDRHQDEKKIDSQRDVADIDLTGDLD